MGSSEMGSWHALLTRGQVCWLLLVACRKLLLIETSFVEAYLKVEKEKTALLWRLFLSREQSKKIYSCILCPC